MILYASAYKIILNKEYKRRMKNLPGLDTAIASIVRAIRSKTGLSQEQFADLAGLSRVYIAQLETGERGASLNSLILIARSVKMTGAELVALIEKEMERINA